MATAIALRFRVNNNTAATIQSNRFINSFSSSSTSSSPKIEDENTTQSPPSQSSNHAYSSDLKSQPPPQQQQRQTRSPLSSRLSTEKPNSYDNMSKIIASLSIFRRRSAAPPSPTTSFEDVYKRNVIPEGQESSNPDRRGGFLTFDNIKEKITESTQHTTPGAMSFSMFPEKKFNLRPVGPNQSEQRQLYGGEHHDLPNSVFGKEIIMKSGEDSSNDAKSKVVYYSYEELGGELKQLRPEEAKGINKSFSLDELDQIRPPRSVDIMRDIIAKMGEKETSEKSMTMRDPLSPRLEVPQPDPQLPVTSQPKKTVKPRKNVKGNQKGRNRNYTQIEDEALVRSWIAISGDGIVGNSQSGSSLWSRIYNTFNEILGIKNPDDDLDRSPNSLACRWTTIQRQVNKFCGYFATVERNPRSGSNFDDWVDDAKKAFRACENLDFKMDELWKILRDNPKWNEKNVAPKRKQSFPSPLDIDDINVDSTPQSNITGDGSSTQQEDDGNHVAPNTIENGSDRPKLGITADGSSAKAINEFVAKLDAFVQQQLAMSEKEITSKEEMHRKDQEMKERHFQQKERLLQQQAQMMRQKQWQSEKDILEKDLSGMDPEQAFFFRRMQRCIWTKWQQEEH